MKISQRCRLPITWLVIYTLCSPIFRHNTIVHIPQLSLGVCTHSNTRTSNTRFSHFPRGDLDFNRRSYPRQRNTHSETVRAEDRAVTESVARSRALYFCLPLSGSLTLSLSHSHPLIHPPSHSPVLSLSHTPSPLSRLYPFLSRAHALPHSCETPFSSWYTLFVSLVRTGRIRSNVPPLSQLPSVRYFTPACSTLFTSSRSLFLSLHSSHSSPPVPLSLSLARSFLSHLPSASALYASSTPFHLVK